MHVIWIWFRFHGIHRVEIEGLAEARVMWDKLNTTFSMVSY